ncbi:MAG TPA: DUF2397 family protein [Mycobacteriales bacterium]|nr:DUF2397 family protein [Mycobacteriales bacterium]
MPPLPGSDGEREMVVGVFDSRATAAYLVAPGSDDYVAVMDVLEASVTDLTPSDIVAALAAVGRPLEERVVTARLDKLREWSAVSARTDNARILRYSDIVARNWRYTATPLGRQVQRFYNNILSGLLVVREIPLTNLGRLVDSLEQMAGLAGDRPDVDRCAELVAQVFTAHDDLDGALVGAEDALAGLADRFDLDDDKAGELKGLLVDYATHVAVELRRGSARAARALNLLVGDFEKLAGAAVEASTARELIARGALTASKGGRVEDWTGLVAWCDPERGRAQRFALRLVRALPGMHANLRRLHTSSGTATSRARALSLAKACHSSDLAPALFLVALGDHSWRKLHGAGDDDELTRVPSWRAGPTVAVPELLRLTGRTGVRGRPAAARDDAVARADVERRRLQRRRLREEALLEVLTAQAGSVLTEPAARLAMTALMAAVRTGAAGPRRSAARDGLACTLFHSPGETGVIRAPTWRVWLPDRMAVFHAQGTVAAPPDVLLVDDRATRPLVVVDGAA